MELKRLDRMKAVSDGLSSKYEDLLKALDNSALNILKIIDSLYNIISKDVWIKLFD